jgi:hypothetical protein
MGATISRRTMLNGLVVAMAGCAVSRPVRFAGADPLPSWNDGPVKSTVLDFVTRVTTEGTADFVPVEERIATFDNDGTLWVEKPLPTEVYFVLARVRELVARDPGLGERQPFKAAVEGDTTYFHETGAAAVLELLLATHTGMTQEQFRVEVQRFFETARHPTLHRPFTELAYQPMLEVLAHLRTSGFQIWLCSGGTVDFMRGFAGRTYGVPPERIIGSEFKRESRRHDGRLSIWRSPAIEAVNDKDGKPVGIDRHIGRRPVVVGGNVLSGGDIAMMEYSKGRSGPSLELLVNHDDAEREFAYAERDNASLEAARRLGFTVVSMARDWRTIFGPPRTRAIDRAPREREVRSFVALDGKRTRLEPAT